MSDCQGFAHLLDVPLLVEAIVPSPTLTVGELLQLQVGSVFTTARPSAETVDLFAGETYVGAGELVESGGYAAMQMVRFKTR